jgi:hypothetical protein
LDGLDSRDHQHPSVGALLRARDHEKEGREAAEKLLKEAQVKTSSLEEEMEKRLKETVPKANIDLLEKSYNEKLAKQVTAKQTEIDTLTASLRTVLVDGEALKIATAIAKDPDSIPLILPHISERLVADVADGKPVTRVLDKDGKPSASTLGEFREEILATRMFASVVLGSKASGGGATGGSGGGSAPQIKDAANCSPADLAAAIKAKKQQGGSK